ncbi:hypothetical protein BDV12DRAFT_162597 [Aspergillus spectabilis]
MSYSLPSRSGTVIFSPPSQVPRGLTDVSTQILEQTLNLSLWLCGGTAVFQTGSFPGTTVTVDASL